MLNDFPEQLIEFVRESNGILIDDPMFGVAFTPTMDATLSVIENYCQRKFLFRESEVEQQFINNSNKIQLKRFPINHINSITLSSGIELENFLIDYDSGIIYLDQYVNMSEIIIDYDGGFVTFPPELMIVFLSVFKKFWGDMNGSGSQTAIKRMSVPDVGTIDYYDDSEYSVSPNMNIRFGEYFNLLDSYKVTLA